MLFLSDNINEVNAAIEAGMKSYIVIRPEIHLLMMMMMVMMIKSTIKLFIH